MVIEWMVRRAVIRQALRNRSNQALIFRRSRFLIPLASRFETWTPRGSSRDHLNHLLIVGWLCNVQVQPQAIISTNQEGGPKFRTYIPNSRYHIRDIWVISGLHPPPYTQSSKMKSPHLPPQGLITAHQSSFNTFSWRAHTEMA